MTDDYRHGYPQRHRQKRLPSFSTLASACTKATPFFILILLSYTLGYFSSSTCSSNNPNPTSDHIDTNSTPTNHYPTLLHDLLPLPPSLSSSGLDHNRFDTRCADPVRPELVRDTILTRVFNGTSPYDNFPPAHVIGLLRPTRIRGWGSNGAVFENLIRKVRPGVIIEVGTFLGASAIHMARLATRLGLGSTQILCLDDFRGWPGSRDHPFMRDIPMANADALLLYQFMQNVVQSGSAAVGSILPVPFSTGSALEALCQWGVVGDLIEVDAGHDFHSAWADINRAYKILRPGGVIFGHDYFTAADNRGVRRAVNLFARLKGLKVKVDGQHWVIDSD